MRIPTGPVDGIPRPPELISAWGDSQTGRISHHARQLPRLTVGPFRCAMQASQFLVAAKKLTALPVKQVVISASALSLLHPGSAIPGYSRDAYLSDLVDEAVTDIRPRLRNRSATRTLLAVEYVPLSQFGTTDACGFSPFADDTSTCGRAAAFLTSQMTR